MQFVFIQEQYTFADDFLNLVRRGPDHLTIPQDTTLPLYWLDHADGAKSIKYSGWNSKTYMCQRNSDLSESQWKLQGLSDVQHSRYSLQSERQL